MFKFLSSIKYYSKLLNNFNYLSQRLYSIQEKRVYSFFKNLFAFKTLLKHGVLSTQSTTHKILHHF